jgi:hypothetical protein
METNERVKRTSLSPEKSYNIVPWTLLAEEQLLPIMDPQMSAPKPKSKDWKK